MKKIFLTAALIGGAMFAANAGDFYLGLPGLSLRIGDGPARVYAPPCGGTVVYRYGTEYVLPPPPPPPPVRVRRMPPPPPPRAFHRAPTPPPPPPGHRPGPRR